MPRLLPLLVVAATALVSCQYQQGGAQPRPFAGRGGQNLDQPPRYGDDNRYVAPSTNPADEVVMTLDPRTAAEAAAAGIDPRTIPPTANTNPPSNLPAPGSTVAPSTAPPVTPAPGATAPAPAGDAPFARAVPGKPGYVYSPKDPSKVISVEGLRGGSKAKDPETGEIFRVPY